ncbi:hypothetical protein BCR42DRAFT_428642 [Absidia repens]|uniref:Uncharacterized protein n=1 Tax=Absidia repens TaxID=90262 RepID=A0A1X2HZG9_9FUNG|nr:hypothetical protein BCR42DRAFT_428642 [Absidia repens]
MARPVVVEVSDLRRSRSVGYRPKKKRKSIKTSASIKRKSGGFNKLSSTVNKSTSNPSIVTCTSPDDMIPPMPSTPTCSSEPSLLPPPSTLLSPPPDENLSSASLNDQLLVPSSAATAIPTMTTSISSSTISSSASTSTHSSPSRSPSSTSLPTTSLAPPQPKRSKSALMKLGSGLTKGHKKTQRQNSAPSTPPASSSTPEMEIDMAEVNFVKRMASLGKRMKLQRV